MMKMMTMKRRMRMMSKFNDVKSLKLEKGLNLSRLNPNITGLSFCGV